MTSIHSETKLQLIPEDGGKKGGSDNKDPEEKDPANKTSSEGSEAKNEVYPVTAEVQFSIKKEGSSSSSAISMRPSTPLPPEIGVPQYEKYTQAQVRQGPRVLNFARLLQKTTWHVVGIMSGTSLDGIDLVLARITGQGAHAKVKALHYRTYPFPGDLRKRVQEQFNPDTASVPDLCDLDFEVGGVFAIAVNQFLKDVNWKADDVDLISTAGQTIWHAPQRKTVTYLGTTIETASTLAIGQGDVIRWHTGIPVICDLRVGDVAAGGEGAPLIPYFDWAILRHDTAGRCFQNIGGIGNVSYVPPQAELKDTFGFDTGPGNMIIDGLVEVATNGEEKRDTDGKRAARGKVHMDIVEGWMQDPYFSRTWPKSTGREKFGIPQFVIPIMQLFDDIPLDDLVATATYFTAESIARSYRDFILPRPIDQIVVGGGGALNPTLMEMFRQRLQFYGIRAPLMRHEHIFIDGEPVDSKSKEALAIALIGHDATLGMQTNTRATGGHATVLGKLIL